MKNTVSILSLLFPLTTFACSVCRGGISKAEQDAYLLTIIILASLPIVMAGIIFFWIKKRINKN